MHSKTPRILFALTLTAFCLETQAGIFGPNTSMHSGLSAASAAGPEELISSKKIIMDKLVDIHCSPPCEPDGAGMAKAADGDAKTSTGAITFLSMDLGDVYVIDSSVINFAHSEKYNIATSLYWNGTLPPTANSSTGIGSLSDAELEHLDFHPILWEEKDNLHGLIDGRKINPTVGRFLHFYFRQESDYEVANLNEVEIYGHKYVSHPQDMVCLNRSKWTSTGSSCKNCGEGWTGPAMYDWLLGPHEMEANAGDWVRIDFGETLSFSQIALVLTSGAKLDLFTTDDTTKWGNPLSSFTVPTSDTVTLNVPTQHARYLKIVNPGEPNGAWWHIFDVTLWSPLDPNSIGLKNQKKENRHSNYEPLMNRIFNLNGRKVTSKSVDFK